MYTSATVRNIGKRRIDVTIENETKTIRDGDPLQYRGDDTKSQMTPGRVYTFVGRNRPDEKLELEPATTDDETLHIPPNEIRDCFLYGVIEVPDTGGPERC